MKLTYDSETVRETLDRNEKESGYSSATFVLEEGQSAWNPASTKPDRSVYGPAEIVYKRFSDGGLVTEVTEK